MNVGDLVLKYRTGTTMKDGSVIEATALVQEVCHGRKVYSLHIVTDRGFAIRYR